MTSRRLLIVVAVVLSCLIVRLALFGSIAAAQEPSSSETPDTTSTGTPAAEPSTTVPSTTDTPVAGSPTPGGIREPGDDEDESFWERLTSGTAFAALAGIVGIVLGAILGYAARYLEDVRRRRHESRREALQGLYAPLYRSHFFRPPMHPETTFGEMEEDELAKYLRDAAAAIEGKVEFADDELIKRVFGWDELMLHQDRDEMESEARWFYGHIQEQFHWLRKKTGLS